MSVSLPAPSLPALLSKCAQTRSADAWETPEEGPYHHLSLALKHNTFSWGFPSPRHSCAHLLLEPETLEAFPFLDSPESALEAVTRANRASITA